MKTFFTKSLLITVSFIFFTSVVYAEKTYLHIVRSDGTYPPNEYVTPAGKLVGIHVDIIEAVAKRLNWSYKIESLPWKRCIKMVEGGEADAIMYVQKSTERENFLWYINNILSESSFSFIVRKGEENDIKFNGDIKSFAQEHNNLGIISGFYYPAIITQAGFNFEKTENEPRMIDKLIGKRMKVALAEKEAVIFIAKTNKTLDKIAFIKPEIVRFNIYLGFSKKLSADQQTKDQAEKNAKLFSAELEKFKTTKQYQEILNKYR